MKRIVSIIVLSGFLFSFLSGVAQAANTPFDPKDYKELGIYFVGEDCNLTGAKTTSDTGGGANSPVFILGDSIMWGGFYSNGGLDKAFEAKDFETIVDAQGSRAIKQYPGKASASSPLNKKATTGLQAVDEDKAEIKKAGTIIIELGTNQEGDNSSSVFKDNMSELVKKIKGVNDQAKIYAVNFFSTSMKNRQAHNKALEEIAEKENMTIIDTTKQSFALDGPGTHPTPEGYKTYNKIIVNALGSSSPGGSNETKDVEYESAGKIPKEGIKVGASIYGGAYRNGSWYIDNKDQIGQINSGKKKASDFDAKVGNPSDDTGIGNRDNPLSGTTSYAELSNGGGNDYSALGDLPNGTKLEISYKGKSIIAEKGDVGAGGSNVKGKPRAIDLWWEALRLLDPSGKTELANGTDVVTLHVVPKKTPITPVGGTSASVDKSVSDPNKSNGCECPASEEKATTLAGSDNAEKVWNYFVEKGLKAFQVAGIMGNFSVETGGTFNPKIVQGGGEAENITVDNKTGYGLAQWTSSGRQQGLKDAAQKANKPSGDLVIQLDYAWSELNTGYKDALKELKASTSVEDATSIVSHKYERPAVPDLPERPKQAKIILAKYGSSSRGASTVSDTNACTKGEGGKGGEIVGEYSLPVDKKWYTQHKDYFTKPHHDHPSADLPVDDGSKVYSMTAGKVIVAPVGGACGNGIIIDAGDGVEFGYCHGSDGGSVSGAKKGDTVKPGQLIMHSDNTDETGQSSGSHLHVQIKIKGVLYCPQKLFVSIAEGNPVSLTNLPTSGCTY